MTHPAPPTLWTHAGVAAGSNGFLLDGIDVFKHPWQSVLNAPNVAVTDPQYGQAYVFPVYRIVLGARTLTFAAGEFSNNVWGFYVPAIPRSTTMTLPPPMPSQIVHVRPSLWRRAAPFAPFGAAIFTVPWIIFLAMMSIRAPEWYRDDPGRERLWKTLFNAGCLAPATIGLLVGLVMVAIRTPTSAIAWIGLAIGCVACVGFLSAFVTFGM